MRWPVLQCAAFLGVMALCLWIALSPRAKQGAAGPLAARPTPANDPEPKSSPGVSKSTDPPPQTGKGGRKDVKAVVKSVDAVARMLVLTVKDKGKESEAAFPVAATVRIRRGGSELTLADVKPAMPVRAILGEGDVVVELRLEKMPQREGADEVNLPGKPRSRDD